MLRMRWGVQRLQQPHKETWTNFAFLGKARPLMTNLWKIKPKFEYLSN